MIDLKRFREDKKITQSEICAILGIAQPYLSAIENGKRPLNKDKFDLLYKQYGDVLLEYKQPDVIINKEEESDDIEDLIYVPLLPISAQGGSLNEFIVSVKDSDCEKIISPIKGADFAITVAGDSMAPEYPSGSQILIKKINERAFIDWGKTYVIDTCNGTVIKILVPSDNEGYVKCLSINTDTKYAPFEIAFEDIYGIYRVMLCMAIK